MEATHEKVKVADALKPLVLKAKDNVFTTEERLKKIKGEFEIVDSTLKTDTARLKELESGKGKKIVISPIATVYEFWIETPSYSGSIQGASCTVRQTGDIKVVPITTGDRSSGLAGALFGAAVGGKKGAVAGSILQRQNKIKTETKTIDTRQFDIDIKGNGWAWSATVGATCGDEARTLRDKINMRGSSKDDINQLLTSQRQKHEQSTSKRLQAFELANLTENELKKAQREYDQIWSEYDNKRVPFFEDLKHRWANTRMLYRILISLCGIIICLTFMAPVAFKFGYIQENNSYEIVASGIVLTIGFCYLYLSKVRLLR